MTQRRDDSIEHEGIVTAVSEAVVTVEIINKSACASCHAKSLCGVSDLKVKTIEVPADGSAHYAGEKVTVVMEKRLGMKAVVISYLIPLVILLILLLSLLSIGVSEPVSALVSVSAAALYFLVVYLMRNRLTRKFVFTIKT